MWAADPVRTGVWQSLSPYVHLIPDHCMGAVQADPHLAQILVPWLSADSKSTGRGDKLNARQGQGCEIDLRTHHWTSVSSEQWPVTLCSLAEVFWHFHARNPAQEKVSASPCHLLSLPQFKVYGQKKVPS